MGADGHILIWRRDRVKATFPDCEELFSQIPTHYLDELDGVQYDHVYWGDNLMDHWTDSYGEPSERMKEFLHWLQRKDANPTEWEVWT